jgi:hypothetical protein
VIDNGSENETKIAIEESFGESPFVTYRRYEDNIDYSEAFHRMMTECHESDWVWTFGDDDKLMPNALEFVLEQLRSAQETTRYFHVAEVGRCERSGKVFKGKLLDLCRNIGWLEMTGFITCNIIRGSDLYTAAQTPRWPVYERSAFVHSCALLEHMQDMDAVFIDLPVVSTQYQQQTEDSILRWIRAGIPHRYLFVADALERMHDDGVLTERQPHKFFRYLNYHLWDRFITHFCNDYLARNEMWADESLNRITRLAKFVDDDELVAQITSDVENARGMITVHHYMSNNINGLRGEIENINQRHAESVFPYGYLTPV